MILALHKQQAIARAETAGEIDQNRQPPNVLHVEVERRGAHRLPE